MAKKLQFNVAGIDLSVNHLGWVMLLDRRESISFGFVDHRAKYQKRNLHSATETASLAVSKDLRNVFRRFNGKENRELLQTARLHVWQHYVKGLAEFFWQQEIRHVTFEQYAYAASGRSAYQIGEIGGIFREAFFSKGFALRFVAPTALKKWASHGTASKQGMVLSATEKDCDIPMDLIDVSMKGEWSGPGVDVADAFWLADILLTELKVRHGQIRFPSLPTRQIEVFNSVSPSMPVNQLARPFVQMPKK